MLYSITLPAAVAFIWTALQALREISHIQFYSGSNMWIADIDNLQNYLDILIKKETEQDQFLSHDQLNGVYPNNSTVGVIPALRNTTTSTTATVANGAANPSSINYIEPAYWSVSAGTAVIQHTVSTSTDQELCIQYRQKFIFWTDNILEGLFWSIVKNLLQF